MQEENRQLLRAWLPELAGTVGRAAAADHSRLGWIELHLEEVRVWNQRVNLTAITEEREMVLKHVLDSAAVFRVFTPRAGVRILDVGTGAGFPGVVLKALAPEIELTLMDKLQKRCRFLEHVTALLWPGESPGVEVLWGRAEEWGQHPAYRESFDLVTARAVADLRVLAELCLPLARVGGHFVALKGPGAEQEVAAAAGALRELGGEVERVEQVNLPEGAGVRLLVTVRKVRPTPERYPRRPGVPERRPLVSPGENGGPGR